MGWHESVNCYCRTISCGCFHHSTIQDGFTALKQPSFKGHHKVVELLIGAEANPDIQDKVRTGQVPELFPCVDPLHLFYMIVLVLKLFMKTLPLSCVHLLYPNY